MFLLADITKPLLDLQILGTALRFAQVANHSECKSLGLSEIQLTGKGLQFTSFEDRYFAIAKLNQIVRFKTL